METEIYSFVCGNCGNFKTQDYGEDVERRATNNYRSIYNLLIRLFIICALVTALCSNDVRTQATSGPHIAVISRTAKLYNIPVDQLEISSALRARQRRLGVTNRYQVH
jgi:hypothetical protein